MRLASTVFAAVVGGGLAFSPSADARTPRDALVVAYNIDAILTFDPAQIGETVTDELLYNVCDPLVFMGKTDETKFEPGLAERWERSADGKTWTFHLRHGLKHPSGNAVTAQDAAWTMKRVLWLGFGNAAQYTEWGFSTAKADEQFVAVDEHTLRITSPEAWPENLLLSVFTGRQGVILDRKTIEPHFRTTDGKSDHGNNWLKTNSACIGPYRLTRWQASDTVILERNQGYWRGEPPLRRVIIRHVGESAAQRLMLEKGDIDLARDLNAEDAAAVDANKELRLERGLLHTLNYIGANLDHPILSDREVRMALRHLIDYQGLQTSILKYEGRIWQSFAPQGAYGTLPHAEGTKYRLDLAKAKEHLAKSKVPNGFKVKLIIGTVFPSREIAQHFQQNAKQVGIDVEIEQMASGQLFSKMRARDFELAYLGWSPGYPDSNANAMRHVYNPDNRAEAKQGMFLSWRAAYHDESMNKAVLAARLETDPAKRVASYHDIQRRFMAEGPFFYIFQRERIMGAHKDLKSITFHPFRVWYATATK